MAIGLADYLHNLVLRFFALYATYESADLMLVRLKYVEEYFQDRTAHAWGWVASTDPQLLI